MKNRYFILRHGQTPYQLKKEKIIYPKREKFPILLTKKGIEQIKKIAQRLRKERIDFIFSSDFPRTRQTAGIIAEELGIEKINFDKRLKEINVGIYTGKSKKELNDDFPENIRRFSKPLPRGESWNDLKKRMTDFLNSLEKKYKDKNILIISHGDPIWMLLGATKKMTNAEILKNKNKLYPKTGQLIILN